MTAHRISSSLSTPMSRRRFLHTLGVASGTAFASSAVLPFRTQAAKKTTLRFLNNETDPNTIAFLKELATEYQKATGVRLQVETIPVAKTWTKVTTAIKAGKPYDLLTFGNVTQPILLAKDDLVVPITDIIKEIGEDDFGPRALTWYQNHVWMYPYDYNFNYLFYRKDWFAENNLQEPDNWEAFLQVLKVLTNPDDKRYAISLPFSLATTNWANTAFLWAGGVEIYDDQWNVILDSPAIKPKAVRTLEFLNQVSQYTPPGMIDAGYKDLLSNFTSGISAMTSYTGRLIHAIEKRAPKLADKYGTMAYPSPSGGRGAVTFANDGLSIAKTENTEATLEFFRWFLQNNKLMEYQLTLPLHYQPPQFSTYENEQWRSHPLVKKHWAAVEVMLSFMNTDKTLVGSIQLQGPDPSPNQGKIWTSNVIPRMYQNILVKKMAPSEAVDAAAEEIRNFTVKG
jgi:multiple sugar transport system substrate-binding protein